MIVAGEVFSEFSEKIKVHLTNNCHIAYWQTTILNNTKRSNRCIRSHNPYKDKTVNEAKKVYDSINTVMKKAHPKMKDRSWKKSVNVTITQ